MAKANNDLVARREKKRGRPEMKWEREVNRVMKQKNLTPEDAVNRQIRRKATENQ
jgi:hypothetical protein